MTLNGWELFAGPGGYSEGSRNAVPDQVIIGYENEPNAIATARAAGHHRVEADLKTFDPRDHLALFGLPDLGHGSPPCQGFSLQGKGKSREDGDRLIWTIQQAAARRGEIRSLIDEFDLLAADPRSALTLTPLLWIAETLPTKVSLEQTPLAMPIWEAYSETLQAWGYKTQVGYLHAEQYGTPQSRRRAVLLARVDGPSVSWPVPSHSRYHERDPQRLDPGVKPWVSISEALPNLERDRPMSERINNQSGNYFDVPKMLSLPSTVITGRTLVTFRGANANSTNGSTKSRNDGFSVTPAEAGVLQGFPADYPWQGTPAKQAQQIGDAVPPPVAEAIVRSLI